jgi:hypothetical protein
MKKNKEVIGMKKGESKSHKESLEKESTCCNVESLVSIDERGQNN